MSKKLTTSDIRAGRIYTFVYDGEYKTVGFRKTDGGRKDNPLAGASVTVRREFKVQAAGKKTYAAVMLKANPNWQPSADYVAFWTPFYDAAQMAKPEDKRNTCIIEHKLTATRYLRGIPKGVNSEVFTIDGAIATPEQVAILKEFAKNKSDKPAPYMTYELSNLNVKDDTDEAEAEDEDELALV